MSAWDQTVVIGRKARPGGSGGGGGPRGPTALERAKQVGAVTANDRKSMYARRLFLMRRFSAKWSASWALNCAVRTLATPYVCMRGD